MSAVRLESVTKRFGAVTAVDDLDLEIRDGEFFSMLGPSGSGKTTVLRMIAGFEAPTSGKVFLGGDDVTKQAPFARNVNTVFQDYALFPHLDVLGNVEYGLAVKKVPRRERRQRAQEALESVRLGGYGGRKPGQLSGGQRQRVALARALVNRPQVPCSTSRWVRWTSSCVARCRSSSSSCSATSASPSCSSPTTRRRRSR